MTIARVQVDRGEYLYLAGKFGFEPAPHKDAFRPLVWDDARHNPGMWKQRLGLYDRSPKLSHLSICPLVVRNRRLWQTVTLKYLPFNTAVSGNGAPVISGSKSGGLGALANCHT